MLRITLTAEDATALEAPQVFDYNHLKPRLKELRELNEQCGVTYQQLLERLGQKDDLAVAMLVWMALVRNGVKILWSDFDLDMADTEIVPVTEDPKDETTN